MILPHTYVAALLLTIFSMICWGSWANTFKLAGKWRFELFYYDYSIGVMLAAAIAALTFGSMGFDGFLFFDDLLHASKHNIFYGFAAGIVFNLANMLLVASISVAGLAVAFPVGIGIALIIGAVLNYLINPQGNPVLLFTGVGVVLVAIIVDALAYRMRTMAQVKAQMVAGTLRSLKRVIPWKGIILSVVAGCLMGSFYPLVEMGKEGELGLGPYAIAFVFATGVLFSTMVFNLFFLNLPVEGPPLAIFEYFKGTSRVHLLGIAGGVIWAAGTIANFAAASSPPEVQIGPSISYVMGQGATMISALWGILVWKEFKGADLKLKLLLTMMLALFILGLVLVAIAPLYAAR
jgi:glucose uptake protein